MNIHESAEDYLERILILHEQNEKVIALDIANSFGYSKASVSRAMKNLRENDYIKVSTNGNIELTDKGIKVAKRIYERHQLLTEMFERIGVSKEIASKDACKIEHDLSDETFEAIKAHIKQNQKKMWVKFYSHFFIVIVDKEKY